jgi:hypothetical protein
MIAVYTYLFHSVYNYFVIRLFEEIIGRGREVEERRRSGLLKNKVRK